MTKTLSAVLRTLLVTIVIIGLMLFALPLSSLPGLPAGVRIIEGARLSGGEALLSSGKDSDLLRWHWCPSSGPTALCITLSGHSGFARGVVTPGVTGFGVRHLIFSGMPLGVLGVAPHLLVGQLDGEIRQLWLSRQGDCFYMDPSRARGQGALSRLRVLGRDAGDHHMEFVAGPDGRAAVQVSGADVNGTIDLSGDGWLIGELRVEPAGSPIASGEPSTLAIKQRLPCAPAQVAGH